MMKRYHWLNQSHYLSPLSKACEMCAKGSKMVILITGLCPAKCFYCPLSNSKQNKDLIFADEWQLKNENDTNTLISEAKAISATGAGITGGDPLLVPERTIAYIRFLKEIFGKKFHIHLYTSGLKNTELIQNMVEAGLDEIRFHPEPTYWSTMKHAPLSKIINKTSQLGVNIAIEIPVLPEKKKSIISLIRWASEQGLDYINLNELEFSEQNEIKLYEKGYTIKNELSAAVNGSQETAYEILDYFENDPVPIGIHYCSSSFKDGIQLTNRIKRRAKNIASIRDKITDEGTLLKGIIQLVDAEKIDKIKEKIRKTLDLKDNDIKINKEKSRIEMHPELLKEHNNKIKKLGFQCFIIEEYPTADQLEVERRPI